MSRLDVALDAAPEDLAATEACRREEFEELWQAAKAAAAASQAPSTADVGTLLDADPSEPRWWWWR